MRVAELNALDRDAFVARLGGVFELSDWVADAVWAARPFADAGALFAAMAAAVDGAAPAAQLDLLRAHPDLAGKAARAGDLTDHSRAEQAGAGLDQLSAAEFARFHEFNGAYREKFGFPFIIAVRDHTKATILAAFAQRLANAAAEERATALAQVARIAELRLRDLIDD